MPNRILKETICTSDTLDELSWFEEVFWYRLLVNCDDFGRFDARPAILKSRLFPLKAAVTDKSICDALNKLSTVGLVILYEFEDKPYLQITTWERHQQTRAAKSKYPELTGDCNQLKSIDINCSRIRNRIRNPIRIRNSIYEDGADAPACESDVSLPKSKKSPQKHAYGEHKNVLLSDTELANLKDRFPDWEKRIESLSFGIALKGYKYKSHYLAILKWAEKDGDTGVRTSAADGPAEREREGQKLGKHV